MARCQRRYPLCESVDPTFRMDGRNLNSICRSLTKAWRNGGSMYVTGAQSDMTAPYADYRAYSCSDAPAVCARLRGVVRQASGFIRATDQAQDSVAMHQVLSTYTGLHGETPRQARRHHRTKAAQSKEENHANSGCMRGRGDVVDRIGRGVGANRGLHGLARRRVRGTGAGLPACCAMAGRTAGHRLRLRRQLQLVRRRGTGRARLGLRWLSVLSLPGQRSADHDVRHGDRSAAHHVFARHLLGSVLSGASVVSGPGPLGASSAATLPSTAAG